MSQLMETCSIPLYGCLVTCPFREYTEEGATERGLMEDLNRIVLLRSIEYSAELDALSPSSTDVAQLDP